jgi:hypothetical protein
MSKREKEDCSVKIVIERVLCEHRYGKILYWEGQKDFGSR